ESQRDDLTDTVSQALRLLRDLTFLSIDPPPPESDYYDEDERRQKVNPYAV
ncbi:MAG: hypothetical protein RL756_2069, partial [Pseudomonadota bacterium]